ncbi:MAG: hypothetical protein K6E62_08095 [Lachnospiraceae bacterium]|nr:hypothetical protein [Lachnospiraceae bacterium]
MINRVRLKKTMTGAITKGMSLVLLTGIMLNGNPGGRDAKNLSYHDYAAEKYNTVAVYAAEKNDTVSVCAAEKNDAVSVCAAAGLSDGKELVTKAASKKSSALTKAQKKAEKKLLKAYNGLLSQFPYSKTNYLKLTDIKNEGVEQIYGVRKKADAGKTAKKYIKSLKKVQNMLVETDEVICVGFNGTVGWKATEGAEKYRVDHVHLMFDVPICEKKEEVKVTYTKVRDDYGVQVFAFDKDDNPLYTYISDYYVMDRAYFTDEPEEDPVTNPVVEPARYPTWNAFEKINEKSLKKNSDGSMSFEVEGPEGETIRFWGEDFEIKNNSIILHTKGRLMMTDGIGRIHSIKAVVSDPGPYSNDLCVYGGYNIDYDMHPGTIDRMVYTAGMGRHSCDFPESDYGIPMDNYEPNFAGVGVLPPSYDIAKQKGGVNDADLTVSKFILEYTSSEKCTPFKELILNPYTYGAYLPGEKYEKFREEYDPYNSVYYFSLYALPDLEDDTKELPVDMVRNYDIHGRSIVACDGNYFKVGDLKDANGKKLDKDNAFIDKGATLNVQLGKFSCDIKLDVLDTYDGAGTLHDLLPYSFPAGTGKRNALVIPIAWKDEPDRANDRILNEFKMSLGRVADLDGKIKDYSDGLKDNRFSLSEYFDSASYGKMNVNSYITDWYKAPYRFSEMKLASLTWNFIKEVTNWLYETYPDVDFSQFDLDSNGYLDQVVLINSGDMSKENGFMPASFGGASQYRQTYGNEYAGTLDRPTMNNVVNINISHLGDNTIIHEFSHGFGLIDYYDVTYSGINAVGCYDMQSDNVGDWNAYSKYAAGWIEPTVVSGLKSGESVEITIGALSEKGDAIVIPAASDEHKPPFSEYMLVDLYTSSGVNKYDSEKYGIDNFTGVRIYHVDARMERRDYINYEFPDMEPCPIGTIHYGNDFKENRMFNIELIQAGAENTFTAGGSRMVIEKSDFFRAGDEFTMKKYSRFFENGLFDNRKDFGYSIEVVSVSGIGATAQAVIRITRQ